MKNILVLCLFVISIANVALFIFWLSLVHMEVSGIDQKKYIYDALLTNISILETILAIVLIGTGVIVYMGYVAMNHVILLRVSKLTDSYFKERAPTVVKQYIKEANTINTKI